MINNLSSKKAFLLGMSALLLAGCGGNSTPAESSVSSEPASSQAESTTPSSTGTAPVVSSEDPKEITIPFWHTFGQTIVDSLQRKAEQFKEAVQANLGVTVNVDFVYKGAYTDIQAIIEKSFAAGTTPTIAIAYPDHVANYLADEGQNVGRYVWNLDDYMNSPEYGFGTQAYLGDDPSYDESDFVEAFINEGKSYIREGTYSLPYMKSSEIMMYNVEATEKAISILHPDMAKGDYQDYMNHLTWTEFMSLAKTAYDNKETVDRLMETPAYYDSDGNLFITKMYQNDIAFSSIKNSTGVIDFESGENRTKAENMISGLLKNVQDGLLTTKGITGVYSSDYFKSMKSIFAIGSSGGAGYSDPSSDTFHVGVCPVPVDNNNPLYVTQGPTMTFLKNTSLSDAENAARMKFAWMFAKYITNPDNNVFLTVSGSQGYIPVRYSAYDSPVYDDYLSDPDGGILVDAAKLLIENFSDSYITSPVFKGSAELRTNCGSILATVAAGEKSISQAFDDAINNAKKFM